VDGLTLTTVSGEVLTIAVEEGAVSVNGISTVILDILTSNGVVGCTHAKQYITTLDLTMILSRST
jgi:hypothetical protein